MDSFERAYLALLAIVLLRNYPNQANKLQGQDYDRADVYSQDGSLFHSFRIRKLAPFDIDIEHERTYEKIWNVPRQTYLTIVRDSDRNRQFTINQWWYDALQGQDPKGYWFDIKKLSYDMVEIHYNDRESGSPKKRKYTVKLF